MTTLVREEFISKNRNKSFTNCSAYIQIQQDALLSCSKRCKLNCQYKHYPADIQKSFEVNDSLIEVHIEHNEMPDVLVKYIPEISFISFVCNFGGLLGMWLGLSLMSTLNEILIPIFKLTWIKLKVYRTHYVNNNIIHIIPIVNNISLTTIN